MRLLSALTPPSIQVSEAAEALRAKRAVVLDVREDREYRGGRIAGARHLPLSRIETASLDEKQRYIAVCRSGARSARATRALRKAGFDVVNLRGGMLAWERAGLPVQRRNGRSG